MVFGLAALGSAAIGFPTSASATLEISTIPRPRLSSTALSVHENAIRELIRKRRTGALDAREYGQERLIVLTSARRWLSRQLGGPSGRTVANSLFNASGNERERVLGRLTGRFGKADAERLLSAVDDLFESEFTAGTFATTVEEAVALKQRMESGQLSERQYYRRLSQVKRSIGWILARHLGGNDGLVLARSLLNDGIGMEQIRQRLIKRSGEQRTEKILVDLHKVIAILPSAALPLGKYAQAAAEVSRLRKTTDKSNIAVITKSSHLKGKIRNWLGAKLGGDDGRSLANAFLLQGRRKDEIAERLVKSHGEVDARTIMQALENLNDQLPRRAFALDTFMSNAAKLKKRLQNQELENTEYMKQRHALEDNVVDWLTLRLGSPARALAEAFLYYPKPHKQKAELFERLEMRFGKVDANAILADLETFSKDIARPSKRATLFVRASDVLAKALSDNTISEEEYESRQRSLKADVISWLTKQLDNEIVSDFIQTGRQQALLSQRLVGRHGQAETDRLMHTLNLFLNTLARNPHVFDKYVEEAKHLAQQRDDGILPHHKYIVARTNLKRRIIRTLSNHLTIPKKGVIARAFLVRGEHNDQIKDELTAGFGNANIEQVMNTLNELRTNMRFTRPGVISKAAYKRISTEMPQASGQIQPRNTSGFPFAIRNHNMLRDFVPFGFCPVDLDKVDQPSIMTELNKTPDIDQPTVLMSAFTKKNEPPASPSKPDIYVLFKDIKDTRYRGIARYSGDVIAAIRLFNTAGRGLYRSSQQKRVPSRP